MMGNKVLAIVVTYNRMRLLKKCLNSLREQIYPCDILVIDNASTDGTGIFLNCEWNGEHCFYKTLSENLGGAGGFSQGLRWGAEHGYEFIWTMDDDCVAKPDTLKALMDANDILGGPVHYGFLSSVVLWKNGHDCKMNRQKPVRNAFLRFDMLCKGLLQIRQATFVSTLFPARIVFQYGLPIEDYFIWGDDIEYTRRIAWLGNEKSYLVGTSQMFHLMESNIGSDISSDSIDRLGRYRYAYRNESFTYRRHGIAGIMFYLARCFSGIYRIIRYAPDNKIRRCSYLVLGIMDGFYFNPIVRFPQNGATNMKQDAR